MADEYRVGRIERLLAELRYEVELGMMQGQVDENLTYRFVVPVSREFRDGVVLCEFRTFPTPRSGVFGDWIDGGLMGQPRLKVIPGGKK